ncbi:MAG: hypothetical protein OEZ59_11230, partial [Deltaproteobacteria bacterium]|nr:hypothetical protein [Deltaproteobacteria bacterium]
GADEIVMHPFGELGPIDPTVSNAFNPVDNINRLQGVSVEDVKAYITFVKNTVGITHEDELVQALNALTEKVHPLALGNVERFLSQSRMMARKILKTHMDDKDSHIIDDIIENLASKLYFHGHPINRKEAKDDLKLKVVTDLPPDLETTMWDLYEIYEKEFNNREIFNPPSLLFSQVDTNARENGPFTADVELLLTVLESTRLTSMCKVKRRYSTGVFQHGQHPAIREDVLELKWSRFLASAG